MAYVKSKMLFNTSELFVFLAKLIEVLKTTAGVTLEMSNKNESCTGFTLYEKTNSVTVKGPHVVIDVERFDQFEPGDKWVIEFNGKTMEHVHNHADLRQLCQTFLQE